MEIYNQSNFFKHTFCEFTQIVDFNFPENNNYKSKSESQYFYTIEGVYRKSNHWGRVANCRWKIITNSKYKNQTEIIGFAKWNDFFPINYSDKVYTIAVDYNQKKASIKTDSIKQNKILFSFFEAQKKVKDINKLFSNDNWAKYFLKNIQLLRKEVITQYLSSNKSMLEIKRSLK